MIDMKSLFALLLVPVCAGCLSAHVPAVSDWGIVPVISDRSPSPAPAFGVARLSQVVVCSPYDARPMLVGRGDGTFASDAYNQFVAVPSRLLKEPARAVLESSGRFAAVVGPTSAASVTHVVELTVTDLRLDCTTAEDGSGHREAVAAVSVIVLDKDRRIVGSARGVARADARGGDYGSAFSAAFTKALDNAMAEF